MAVLTMSTCFCRCSSMLWWLAIVPMTMQYTGAKESHCLSGTFWQNLTPWTSSVLTPSIKPLWCLCAAQVAQPKQMQGADSRATLEGDLGFHQGAPQALVATPGAGKAGDTVAGWGSQAWSSHGFCHCQPKCLQGDDGTGKGGPTTSPCYGCHHRGREGLLHCPPMLHWLSMLHQPQEVQILQMVKKKLLGNSTP